MPPVREYYEWPTQSTTLQTHENHLAFISKTHDEVLAALMQAGKAKIYGMVHAYAAHHLVQWPQLANPTISPNVVNLIRHPVNRIESMKLQLMHETKFSKGVKENLENHFDAYVDPAMRPDICDLADVDYTNLEARSFIYAASSVLVFDEMDLAVDTLHLAMERLVSDRNVFSWLVMHLSGGAASASPDYLEKVFSMGRRNHRSEPVSAADQFMCWAPWQANVAKLLMENYNAENLYQRFGYDFSFLY